MEWLTAGLVAFGLIVPIELPDKTFIATLVLATRYRPMPVWIGVSSAFFVQCLVAVAASQLITLLPELPVRLGAATLFIIGGIVLFVGARKIDAEEARREEEYEERIQEPKTGWRAVIASFLVLFAAEWGDLSQLLTVSLVASGRPAVPVFIGSFLGLVTVAGAGVLLGRILLKHVRLSLVRYIGAAVCAILAAYTLVTAVQSA